MKGLSQLFIKRVKLSWAVEFPWLKWGKLPPHHKLSGFICDKYWNERKRLYLFSFSFSKTRNGQVWLEIIVSDGVSPSFDYANTPNPRTLTCYRLGDFEGLRKDEGWYLTGLTNPDPNTVSDKIEAVINDVNARLKVSVFPKLEIAAVN